MGSGSNKHWNWLKQPSAPKSFPGAAPRIPESFRWRAAISENDPHRCQLVLDVFVIVLHRGFWVRFWASFLEDAMRKASKLRLLKGGTSWPHSRASRAFIWSSVKATHRWRFFGLQWSSRAQKEQLVQKRLLMIQWTLPSLGGLVRSPHIHWVSAVEGCAGKARWSQELPLHPVVSRNQIEATLMDHMDQIWSNHFRVAKNEYPQNPTSNHIIAS